MPPPVFDAVPGALCRRIYFASLPPRDISKSSRCSDMAGHKARAIFDVDFDAERRGSDTFRFSPRHTTTALMRA